MFGNSEGRGLNGQVPADLPPAVEDTPFGRIRTFMTERGTVVVENAPGQATLDADGFGFQLLLEFGPRRQDGCAVGPYHTVSSPPVPRHDAETRAREGILSAMQGAALRFLRAHEPDVLARAVESIREDLARLPEAAPHPAGPPPTLHKVFETPYGGVEASVGGDGLIEFAGVGFQAGILVGDRGFALSGSLNPDRPDGAVFRLTPLFSEDRAPVYHWRSAAPDIAGLVASVVADGETRDACARRIRHDRAAAEAANAVRARDELTANLRRLTARLDALDPELSGLPTP